MQTLWSTLLFSLTSIWASSDDYVILDTPIKSFILIDQEFRIYTKIISFDTQVMDHSFPPSIICTLEKVSLPEFAVRAMSALRNRE